MNSQTTPGRSYFLSPVMPSDGRAQKSGIFGERTGHDGHSTDLGMPASQRREAVRNNGKCIRVVLADDHRSFRDGLRKLIESQPGLHVAGESSVGAEVVRLARDAKPDLLLLDLGLPGRSGLMVLNELARLSSSLRVLALATIVEERSILEAFHFGAHGVVLKCSTREVLLQSIHSVISGQYWMDGESGQIVIEALRRSAPFQNGVVYGGDYGLTPRELKIVGRIVSGSSNKEVGNDFSISERTVKHHLTNIFNKLGISGRVELAVFALEHGLVSRA